MGWPFQARQRSNSLPSLLALRRTGDGCYYLNNHPVSPLQSRQGCFSENRDLIRSWSCRYRAARTPVRRPLVVDTCHPRPGSPSPVPPPSPVGRVHAGRGGGVPCDVVFARQQSEAWIPRPAGRGARLVRDYDRRTGAGLERLHCAMGSHRQEGAGKPDGVEQPGGVRFQDGRFEEAETLYRKAVELAPNNPRALYNLGLVLVRQGRSREAVVWLERALAVNPEFAPARDLHRRATQSPGR